MFPFLVQYFSEIGVSRGLIQCINDPDEATIDIFKNIWKVIDNYKLNIENLTSFGADNANAFYGKHHSVFQLLKDKVHHLLKGKYKRLLWDFLIIFIRPVHFALLYFSAQSFNFLTWKNVIDVADVIHIDDLDKDQLNSEFCDIKCLYDSLRKKNIKLCDQMKSYVSSKTNDFYALNITDQHVAYDECDDEEIISLSDKKDKDFIRSDELWAYLLNINPNATTNFKNLICYIFSILC
ncbi:unnamed protein product [Rotaria sp. Silwood2]|nr:unnamed protein product [Rotaria sp. Silwood2]CAF2698705.1 unnamed protein product [Rotaria sp. Silwood2]